jgi:hypothetical protein
MSRDSLAEALLEIEGVEERPSRFRDGPAFWVGTTEIAHFDNQEVMDIRLTAPLIRSRRSDLRAHPAVTLRNSSSADWLELQVKSDQDELFCVELVREAARANALRT